MKTHSWTAHLRGYSMVRISNSSFRGWRPANFSLTNLQVISFLNMRFSRYASFPFLHHSPRFHLSGILHDSCTIGSCVSIYDLFVVPCRPLLTSLLCRHSLAYGNCQCEPSYQLLYEEVHKQKQNICMDEHMSVNYIVYDIAVAPGCAVRLVPMPLIRLYS